MSKYCMWTLAGLLVVFTGCQQTTVEGTGGKKLTLKQPGDVSLARGALQPVDVSITREKFSDAVQINFENLPQGVSVETQEMQIGAQQSSAKFQLKAAEDAGLVKNHQSRVTVTGPDGMKASETFTITVKEKG